MTGWMAMGLVAALLFSCSEGPEPVTRTGAFTAWVSGELSDTLSGPAVYRMRDSTLVGLELGVEEGSGLSVEFEPHVLGSRTYQVVDRLGTSQSGWPGVVAFLTLGSAQMEATQGTLDLTPEDSNQVQVTFDFEMNGSFTDSPAELSVRVTGMARATVE